SIEQDADVVMFVYREAYYVSRREPKSREGTDEYLAWQEEMERAYGKAEIIIGKQRHGPIGTVEVAFEESLTKFSDLAKEDRYIERPNHQDRIRAERGGEPGPTVTMERTRPARRDPRRVLGDTEPPIGGLFR
ncbi:MAG: hypothetical protein MI723_10185, partial [Caulobacterales bacterium]|nr:hypothetical protein [Caulobacterales bacterium]